jgi:CRISPR-associated protein Csd2
MNARGLYIFKHDSKLGNAPAHKLFDLISVKTESPTPRNFSDYSVTFSKDALPKGVVLDSRSF